LLNIAQGLSLGLFIPVSVSYVQKYTSDSLQTTAFGIFNGVSFGLGNWFFTLIGGMVLEYSNIHFVYLLFSCISLFGMSLLVFLHIAHRKLDMKEPTNDW
jgi:PPP family 3-phenylpropionic acid transporter